MSGFVEAKQAIREEVWERLEARGVARFPFPVVGRIPNFAGAQEAADRLATLDAWDAARVIKANPDSPQRSVRQRALEEGKVLYMAVPRLREAACFVELDPRLLSKPQRASSIKGAFALGHLVRPERVRPVDLVVAGSVAVDGQGGRVGKGGGYSDLEYALGRTFGFLGAETPVVTTVHPLQKVEEVPMAGHDVPLDVAATPREVRPLPTIHAKPEGLDWDLLPEDRVAAIPILTEMRAQGGLP